MAPKGTRRNIDVAFAITLQMATGKNAAGQKVSGMCSGDAGPLCVDGVKIEFGPKGVPVLPSR